MGGARKDQATFHYKKMALNVYEAAVLGAGVQGSATAYYLAKKAGIQRVLLLEQVNMR